MICHRLLGLTVLLTMPGAASAAAPQPLDADAAGRFAALALDCVHKEYPNKIAHVLNGDGDVKPPRELTPAFYGCYDWHSAVHGHWLLARLARRFPERPSPPRPAAPWREPHAGQHRRRGALPPRAPAAPPSSGPTAWPGCSSSRRSCASGTTRRPGAGPQTARSAGGRGGSAARPGCPSCPTPSASASTTRPPSRSAWCSTGRAGPATARPGSWSRGGRASSTSKDRSCPLAYEPSGEDFLSPCLAEADLMRRVLPPAHYATWLADLPAPDPRSDDWLAPAVSTDRPTPSSPISTASTSPGPGCWKASPPACPQRPAPPRPARRRRGPPRSRPGVGHRRALRRRPLAGQLRYVLGDGEGVASRHAPSIRREIQPASTAFQLANRNSGAHP